MRVLIPKFKQEARRKEGGGMLIIKMNFLVPRTLKLNSNQNDRHDLIVTTLY